MSLLVAVVLKTTIGCHKLDYTARFSQKKNHPQTVKITISDTPFSVITPFTLVLESLLWPDQTRELTKYLLIVFFHTSAVQGAKLFRVVLIITAATLELAPHPQLTRPILPG